MTLSLGTQSPVVVDIVVTTLHTIVRCIVLTGDQWYYLTTRRDVVLTKGLSLNGAGMAIATAAKQRNRI